jgi:hypothetical protein
MVSPMAMSTPICSLTFGNFVATSQGHLVSSLSQSQSTSAARRKGDSHPQKGNAAKKKRGKLDTDNGGPQRGNAAKKKRGKLDTDDGTGYKAPEKRSAKTDAEDDAKYNDKEDVLPIRGAPFGVKQREERCLAEFNRATVVAERRGKIDTKDEAEYDDKEDVLPVTDATFGVIQQDKRRVAEFNTATVVAVHQLEFMQRAFPPQPANVGKKKTQGSVAVSIKACRPQSEVDYIMYILMHWQVSVRLTDLNPGTERDRLQKC